MADLLKYRFPGEEKVLKYGAFSIIENIDEYSGFIISDFLLKKSFLFMESDSKASEIHFSKHKVEPISKESYLNKAQNFIEAIKQRALGKAVFSRTKSLSYNHLQLQTHFDQLCDKYPNALVYLVSSDAFGTWIGATPEILLSSNDESAETMALAGTKKENDTSSWGAKELEEQKIVKDFIVDQLYNSGCSSIKVEDLQESIAGPVKHLRNRITFRFGENNPFEVLKSLHPTPAVSGYPQSEAIELILESEYHDRQFYTGVIGHISEEKSKLYVNLRCAQLYEDEAVIYAGGGFTRDSIPENEWQETENKIKTLQAVLCPDN